jgi:hypothetical protein
MNFKKLFCLILVSSLFQLSPLSAQNVWPGDVNNNGIVNGVDLLYLGLAHGSTGPSRAEVSTDWAPQAILSLWSESFPDGTNYAYADCDGNGIVEEEDIDDGIEDNFGETHGVLLPDGYANALPGEGPRIRLVPDMTMVGEGAIVNIALIIDDELQLIDSLYGVAMKIGYTTGLLEGGDGPDFDLIEDSWFDADGALTSDLFIDNDGMGSAELAFTKLDQQPVTVENEPVGNFSIVIEDIIVGLSVDTFQIWVDSIKLIDNELQTIAVVTDTVDIIITKPVKVEPNSRVPNSNKLKVFPNPNNGNFYIEAPALLEAIQLTNELGQLIPITMEQIQTDQYYFALPELPPGIYVIIARSAQHQYFKKIVITN